MLKKRKLLKASIGGALVIILIYGYFPFVTRNVLYDDVDQVPHREVAIVLGTTPGSDHFKARMDAAAELYRAGRVNKLLLSGGVKNHSEDETQDMRRELIEHGVPADVLLTDPYGYRTLDSMIRAKEVFGLRECIVVSQPFHNARAVVLGNTHGLDTIGYNARKAVFSERIFSKTREILARIRAVLDLTFGTEPDTLDIPPKGIEWQPTQET